MKDLFKNILEKLPPSVLLRVRSWNNRRFFRRRFHGAQVEARARLFQGGAPRVMTGPFSGMPYLDETVWGSIVPKWLGSYEWELGGVISEILDQGYATVVDVGCAEGYYAAGLARRLVDSRIFAFDADPFSRGQTRRLAALAGVSERVSMGSFCQHSDLVTIRRDFAGSMLVVCDIEGSEWEFLDPVQCRYLEECDILVEIHEVYGIRDFGASMSDRFAATHEIHSIALAGSAEWAARNAVRFSGLGLDQAWLESMAREFRARGNAWLWMKSRRSGKR
jgi:hypothetical protein